MREIKFRAWDKAHKEMMNWEQYKNELLVEDFEDDDLTIMQYTGSKDRNGKEIYEGDICTTYDLTNIRKTGKGAVVYDELEFLYAIGKIPLQYYVYNTATDTPRTCLEVVGNVYENPELLEV